MAFGYNVKHSIDQKTSIFRRCCQFLKMQSAIGQIKQSIGPQIKDADKMALMGHLKYFSTSSNMCKPDIGDNNLCNSWRPIALSVQESWRFKLFQEKRISWMHEWTLEFSSQRSWLVEQFLWNQIDTMYTLWMEILASWQWQAAGSVPSHFHLCPLYTCSFLQLARICWVFTTDAGFVLTHLALDLSLPLGSCIMHTYVWHIVHQRSNVFGMGMNLAEATYLCRSWQVISVTLEVGLLFLIRVVHLPIMFPKFLHLDYPVFGTGLFSVTLCNVGVQDFLLQRSDVWKVEQAVKSTCLSSNIVLASSWWSGFWKELEPNHSSLPFWACQI